MWKFRLLRPPAFATTAGTHAGGASVGTDADADAVAIAGVDAAVRVAMPQLFGRVCLLPRRTAPFAQRDNATAHLLDQARVRVQ